MDELNFDHIRSILYTYFAKIVGRIPHISDKNKDLPIENRFTYMYYKCQRVYRHSHEPYDSGYTYTNLTLEDAIDIIVEKNLDIEIPT